MKMTEASTAHPPNIFIFKNNTKRRYKEQDMSV